MRKQNLQTLNKFFSALAEPNRLRILAALSLRNMAVCEIRELLKLSFSTVSKHLTILKEAGLIDSEKDGKWVNYRLGQNLPPEIEKIKKEAISYLIHDEKIKEDLKLARCLDRNKICSVSVPTSKPKIKIINRRNKS
ncbi:MAG: ArsR/SmtB family transcription factor [Candidatus Saccharicenans sp.]